MPRNLRRIAFIFCLMPVLSFVLIRFVDAAPTLKPLHGHRHTAPSIDWIDVRGNVLISLGFIGAVGLLVDAIRRPSDSAKSLPVAIAGFGLITIGMSSLVYSLIWGIRLTAAERGPMAATLCAACVAATLDRPPPDTSMHNLMGSALIGASEPCPHCGSIIRTVWFVFMVPLFPFGSYRTITRPNVSIVQASYVGRKVPKIFWPQVVAIYTMTAVIVAVGCGSCSDS